MFLRAPVAEAEGRWHLVPHAEAEGLEVWGDGVPVDCVADLPARVRDLLAVPSAPGSDLELVQQSVSMWVERGLRTFVGRGVRELLDPGLPAAARAPRPGAALFRDARGGSHVLWTLAPAPTVELTGETLLVLVPPEESPEAVLSGRGWAALADARGALIAGLHSPFDFGVARAADGGPFGADDWFDALFEGATRRVVVARGRTLVTLQLHFARREVVPFDALVAMAAVGSPVAAPEGESEAKRAERIGGFLPGAHRLLIAPGGDAPGEAPIAAEESFTWLDGEDPWVLGDRELPGRIAAWLARLGPPAAR